MPSPSTTSTHSSATEDDLLDAIKETSEIDDNFKNLLDQFREKDFFTDTPSYVDWMSSSFFMPIDQPAAQKATTQNEQADDSLYLSSDSDSDSDSDSEYESNQPSMILNLVTLLSKHPRNIPLRRDLTMGAGAFRVISNKNSQNQNTNPASPDEVEHSAIQREQCEFLFSNEHRGYSRKTI